MYRSQFIGVYGTPPDRRKRVQLHLTSAQLCLDRARKFHVEQIRGVSATEVAEVDQSTLSSESRLAET
jgi:hypothetical protein